jgi:hypothetical protein
VLPRPMRKIAILAIVTLLTMTLAGCTASNGDSGQNPTSDAPVVKKDATVTWAGEVSNDRTLRVTLSQDGAELRAGTFTVTAAKKNVKADLFTQSVAAKDFQIRVFEGSNPTGTEKVQPQTCSGQKVVIDVHATDDAVHISWKCG